MNVLRIALVLVFTGCSSSLLTPPTGPGTPYPCGYFGTSCYAFDASRTCCPEHYQCVQLDPGCEYSGNPDVPSPGEFGARKDGPPKLVARTAAH